MKEPKRSNESLIREIKTIIENSRKHVFQIANSALLESYWNIGKLIVEYEQEGQRKAAYGKSLLENLARQLTLEFGRGYDASNLRNMRLFYQIFPKCDALRHELSWTHYRILSRIEGQEKRNYYLRESISGNWTSRVLQRQINTLTFERALANRNAPPKTQPIHDFIKDPYIFEFLNLKQNTSCNERAIETSIIDHIQQFLLEFGKGFAFVARQQRVGTDTSDFFIDLVFYNYILKCFVLIDIKTGELSHQDIGQLDMYVRMYDDLKRGEGDNPTLGMLLCTEKDETIVKYSVLNDGNNLFASKYLLYLPKEEELKILIEREQQKWLVEEDRPQYRRAS